MTTTAPEVSKKTKDEPLYVGISPSNGRALFAAPKDATRRFFKRRMTFNQAAACARRLNKTKYLGHTDWRVPTKGELDLLQRNKNSGDLNKTFKEAASYPASWYWSSTTKPEPEQDYAWNQLFSDGSQAFTGKASKRLVRCVCG